MPYGWVDFCRRYEGECDGAGASPVDINLSPKAEREIDRVNRWVNAHVESVSDMDHWGLIDRWEEFEYVAPAAETVPPFVNFAPLENSAARLTRSANHYTQAWAKSGAARGDLPSPEVSTEVNRLLRQSERKLLSPDGLPSRPWYKHEIYAPGFYTGYAVKTLPAVREAIEQKKWSEVDADVATVAHILDDEAALIDSAAAKLAPSAP